VIHRWSRSDIPSLSGRRALVTGATQGIGYEVARALAGAGAEVIVAGRTRDGVDAAKAMIVRENPGARVSGELLDLSRFVSVRDLADRLRGEGRPIDLLINNAGILAPKTRRITEDGFEAQFQINYLAHFLLTAALLPLLRLAPAPRVTHVSSLAHHFGRINFDDVNGTRWHSPMLAYAQSKLANLLFTVELQRRSDVNGWSLLSTAAHPGIARTALVENSRGRRDVVYWLKQGLGTLLTQSGEAGALPTLYAATSPDAAPMGYYGPRYLFGVKGPAARARLAPQAHNVAAATRLWQLSIAMTNAPFPG